jgi:hypothetical protein
LCQLQSSASDFCVQTPCSLQLDSFFFSLLSLLAAQNLKKLITSLDYTPVPGKPLDAKLEPVNAAAIRLSSPPDYKLGDKVATRAAYGTALVKLNSDRVVALDCDVKNSTFSEKLRQVRGDVD